MRPIDRVNWNRLMCSVIWGLFFFATIALLASCTARTAPIPPKTFNLVVGNSTQGGYWAFVNNDMIGNNVQWNAGWKLGKFEEDTVTWFKAQDDVSFKTFEFWVNTIWVDSMYWYFPDSFVLVADTIESMYR